MSRKTDCEYDDTDKKFVQAINKIDDEIIDQRVAGGKRVDEYVREKGGIQYGEATIETIAQHPDIHVRGETLRRWWALYRIYQEMGEEILAVYPKVRARDYYALSRILDAAILTRDGESQEDARRRTIMEVVGSIVARRKKGNIPCGEVSTMVTKVIDAGAADNVIKKKDPEEKPDRRSKIAKAISFDNIKDAVKYLENFSDPEHLESASINIAELCLEFNRLADSLGRLADHLARKGDKEAVREKIRSLRCKLNEIETILGSDSVTWAQDPHTGVNIEAGHAN